MFCSGAILTGLVALFWQGDPTTADLVFGGVAGIANGVAILMLYAAYSRGSLRHLRHLCLRVAADSNSVVVGCHDSCAA